MSTDYERRQDARREEWEGDHAPNMECEACGFKWYSPILRSRLDPPEPRYPDCPRCDS